MILKLYIHELTQTLHAAATGQIRGQTGRISSCNTNSAKMQLFLRQPATLSTTETQMHLTLRCGVEQQRTAT